MKQLIILITLGLIFVTSAQAQLTDSLWLYFEDGIGNKDSLLIGGRMVDTINPDPAYFETPFQEFDPVFGVGFADFVGKSRYDPNESTFSKGYISEMHKRFTGSEYSFTAPREIYVRIEHHPLTIYYDSTFFNQYEYETASFSPSSYVLIVFPEAYIDIPTLKCLQHSDTIVYDFRADDLYNPDTISGKIKGGGTDTLWGIFISEWDVDFGGPCPVYVGTDEEEFAQQIQWYISPAGILTVHNQSSLTLTSYSLRNIDGTLLTHNSARRLSPDESINIPAHNLPSGMYLLQLMDDSRHVITKKITVVRE